MCQDRKLLSRCFISARERIRLNSQILPFPMDLEWQTFSGNFVFINLKIFIEVDKVKGQTFKKQGVCVTFAQLVHKISD